MRPARTQLVIGTIAILTVTLAFAIPLSARARSSGDTTALALVSAARSNAKVGPVSSVPALDAVAKRQSERMRAAGRIFHNTRLADDLNAAHIRWTVAGENVGVGPTVQDVHRAFMASASHRDNVLARSYNAVGVSVSRAEDGRVYVTQVFAQLGGTSCGRTVIAEDGTPVRSSFYGAPC